MLNGGEVEKLGLGLLMKEMQNVAKLYESHRLYVYQSCMYIFHRLFVEVDDNMNQEGESIEDIFDKVQKIFESYHLDSIYYHINLVFEFLKLEYYNHYKVYRQAEKYYEEVNDACANLMVNYSTYTFPSQFLLSKLDRHLRTNTEAELYAENESIFIDYEIDTMDVPKHIVYTVYRALSSYYIGKFDESARLINGLLNDVSLKKYPYAQLEIKSLLALQYTLMRDVELFNQLSNSIQRQIRLFGKDSCENIQLFLKILKISTSEAKKEKAKKITAVIPRLNSLNVSYFAPTKLVKLDDRFVNLLTEL
jgi:tetratricopeptide (TPR) repeat protein